MYSPIVYIAHLFVYFLFFIFFWCVGKKRKEKLAKVMQYPEKEIIIYLDLFKLEKEYLELKNDGAFNNFPQISRYLEDVTTFLNSCSGKINLMNILIREAQKIKDTNNKDLLSKELNQCSDSVAELVRRKNNIAVRIILLKFEKHKNFPGYIKLLCYALLFQALIIKILSVIFSKLRLKLNLNEKRKQIEYKERICKFNNKIKRTCCGQV